MFTTDIFGRAPFLRITIPFLLGIVAGECGLFFSIETLWLAVGAGCIYGCLLFFYRKVNSYRFRWVWGVSAFLFLFFSGVSLWQQQKKTSELPVNKSIVLNAVVVEHPVQKPKSVQLKVGVEGYSCEGVWYKSNENIVVYVKPDSTGVIPKAGDRTYFEALLQPIKPPSNPEEFDYRKYMQRRGYFATAFVPNSAFKVLDNNALPFYKAIPLKIQQRLLNMFSSAGIEGQELAVLMALTIGDKQLLDDDVREAYSSAGVIHILAVSGLHVGLLYMLLTVLLFFLKGSKGKIILKAAITFLCLWFYASIADFSPSVTRAAIMFSFIVLAQIFGRQTSTLNSVFASAFFICLFKPLSVFDVGFQLSYIAVLGILAFYPKLKSLAKIKNPILNGIWNTCCVSFAAQIATLPLSVYYFHQLPLYFLLANMLVLPLVVVAVYLIVLFLAVSFIPILSLFLGWLLSICVWLISYAASAVHQLPFSTWDRIYLSPSQLLLCMTAVVLLMLLTYFRKRFLLWIAVGCLLVSFSLSINHYMNTSKQSRLVVFDVRYASYIAFVEGRNAVGVRNDKSVEASFLYSTDGFFIKYGISDENIQSVRHSEVETTSFPDYLRYYKGFFWFCGRSIKLLGASASDFYPKEPFSVDILVVTQSYKKTAKEALACYNPRLTILDSSLAKRMIDEWIATLNDRRIPYHSVKEKGALALSW